MDLGVGPGSVWVVRRAGAVRVVVLLTEAVTTTVVGAPYFGHEPVWRGQVLLDVDCPVFEGTSVSYSRSHLFRVFERLT